MTQTLREQWFREHPETFNNLKSPKSVSSSISKTFLTLWVLGGQPITSQLFSVDHFFQLFVVPCLGGLCVDFKMMDNKKMMKTKQKKQKHKGILNDNKDDSMMCKEMMQANQLTSWFFLLFVVCLPVLPSSR